MIQRIIGKHKSNWNLAIFSVVWAYQTYAKNSTIFTTFQLIYETEEVIPIKCEIPSLWLDFELLPNTIDEVECLVYLSHLDEHRHQDTMANKSNKKWTKTLYDHSVRSRIFVEEDLVLVYAQEHDILVKGKFKPLWNGPYLIK